MLWTLDEARAAVAASAAAILDHAQCDLGTRSYLVWGAGGMEGLSPADEVPSRRHRSALDALIELGYAWVAAEELEGLCSAAGIDGDGDADVDEAPGWASTGPSPPEPPARPALAPWPGQRNRRRSRSPRSAGRWPPPPPPSIPSP
jgi:hypothetical protein